jgi:hypothetical protein
MWDFNLAHVGLGPCTPHDRFDLVSGRLVAVVALGPTIFNMNVPLFDELDIGKALGERLPR